MPTGDEFKVGDTVTCNIFRIGLTQKKYIEVLRLASRGKEDEIKKIKGSSSIMTVPRFTGEVIEVQPILKGNLIITVLDSNDNKVMLLDTYWNKNNKKKGT